MKKDLILHFFPSYCIILKYSNKNTEMDDNINLNLLIRKASIKEGCFIRFMTIYSYGKLKKNAHMLLDKLKKNYLRG